MNDRPTLRVVLVLTDDETLALWTFAVRVCWADLRGNVADDLQASLLCGAFDAVIKGLAHIEQLPR